MCSAQNGADEPQVMPLPSSAFTSVITGQPPPLARNSQKTLMIAFLVSWRLKCPNEVHEPDDSQVKDSFRSASRAEVSGIAKRRYVRRGA